MKIKIKNDERVVIVGATGSGKTVLAKHLLQKLNRVFVIDPKHTFHLEGFRQRKRLPLFGSDLKMIYRPDFGGDEDLAGMLYDLLRQEHITIYCDELSTLSEIYPASTTVLADIARTGRERHVSVWTALQRPRWVPRVFFTEAEIVFMFNLRSSEDRAYMAQFTDPIVNEPIEKYAFWYARADEDTPALMMYKKSKNYIEEIG